MYVCVCVCTVKVSMETNDILWVAIPEKETANQMPVDTYVAVAMITIWYVFNNLLI